MALASFTTQPSENVTKHVRTPINWDTPGLEPSGPNGPGPSQNVLREYVEGS